MSEEASSVMYEKMIENMKSQGIDPSQPVTGHVLAAAISGQFEAMLSSYRDVVSFIVTSDIEDKGPIYQAVKEAINSEK